LILKTSDARAEAAGKLQGVVTVITEQGAAEPMWAATATVATAEEVLGEDGEVTGEEEAMAAAVDARGMSSIDSEWSLIIPSLVKVDTKQRGKNSLPGLLQRQGLLENTSIAEQSTLQYVTRLVSYQWPMS
jgi:hypothetical protein